MSIINTPIEKSPHTINVLYSSGSPVLGVESFTCPVPVAFVSEGVVTAVDVPAGCTVSPPVGCVEICVISGVVTPVAPFPDVPPPFVEVPPPDEPPLPEDPELPEPPLFPELPPLLSGLLGFTFIVPVYTSAYSEK